MVRAANAAHKQDWRTPKHIFDALNRDFGPFDRDLFATADNALCRKFYTAQDDAMMQPWRGVCFGNPPYGRRMVDEAIQKAIHEVQTTKRADRVVLLLGASVSTEWFHLALANAEVQLYKGRIAFEPRLPNTQSFISNAVFIFERDGLRGVTATRSARTGEIVVDMLERPVRG